jgi:hypothetical protein
VIRTAIDTDVIYLPPLLAMAEPRWREGAPSRNLITINDTNQ